MRFALAALAALFAIGIAFHTDIAKGRVVSDRLVGVVGEEELPKFAVVDMVDALDQVVEASAGEK
jgi:hypothetical protein